MNIIQTIAKNTVAISFTEVTTTVINLFFFMIAARYLGAQRFGLLSFSLAFAAIFNVFTDIGLNKLMIREVAKDRSQTGKYAGNMAAMKIILCAVTFGLIALVINLLGYPQQTIDVVYLIGISVVANAFSWMFYSVFQAHERMEFISIGEILRALLLLAGTLFAIEKGLSVTAFASIYLMAGVVALGFNSLVLMRKFTRPKIEIDLVFWKEALKQAWPFGLTVAFAGVVYWISSVILSLIHGDEAVGWYSGAYRVTIALISIFSAYSRAIFPTMSKLYVSSPDSLKSTLRKSIKYMIILAIPICTGITLLADDVILLIFGAEYYPSIAVLRISVWITAFVLVSAIVAELFYSIGKQVIVTIIGAGSVFLITLLNLLLIPKYSYVGASIAAVVTEFVALVLVLVWSRKIGYGISAKTLTGIVSQVLLASAAMGVFVLFLQGSLDLWWLIPLASLLYFTVLYLVGGVNREDVILLGQMMRRQPTVPHRLERKG